MPEGPAAPPYGAPQFRAPEPSFPYAPASPASPVPAAPAAPAPTGTSSGLQLTDAQLHQLPPPAVSPNAVPAEPERPATITLAATLAVTASLQWLCGLSLLWLLASSGTRSLAQAGSEGVIFHLLNRFDDRMLDGLALPLYGFPLLSFVTGTLVPVQRPWTRLAHTAVGLAALAWSAWWLRDNLFWWVVAATYITLSCVFLWTPAATRWYTRAGTGPAARPAPQPMQEPGRA